MAEFFTHHTCIKVSDIEGSKAFYQEALGFYEKNMVYHTPEIVSCFLNAPDDGMQLQLLKIPGAAIDQTAYGHLGMRVEDINESLSFHTKMGCVSSEVVEQPSQFGYFIKDPDGYETEIVQLK